MSIVPDEERVRRVVEDGSRRKRDLSVYRRLREKERREEAERRGAVDRKVSALWLRLAADLARSVPPSTYLLWLGPLCPVGAEGDALLLAAPDSIRVWVERRYASLIEEVLASLDTDLREVKFV